MNTTDHPDKRRLHAYCVEVVQKRIAQLEAQLEDLAESVANETKSTAGDKYETARAMLHIEQDQIRRQLAENRSQLAVLQSIEATRTPIAAGPGALVRVDEVWYYLSSGLGKLTVEGRLKSGTT